MEETWSMRCDGGGAGGGGGDSGDAGDAGDSGDAGVSGVAGASSGGPSGEAGEGVGVGGPGSGPGGEGGGGPSPKGSEESVVGKVPEEALVAVESISDKTKKKRRPTLLTQMEGLLTGQGVRRSLIGR